MALTTLPAPADRVIHLTVVEKTGQHQPLAHKTRLNEYAPYIFGQGVVLLIAQWGRFRVPVAAAVVDPTIPGHQNSLFRQMLKQFFPPSWAQAVIVDAAFATKATLKLIQQKGWYFVFGLARTWKLADGRHLREVARHTPRSCYHRIASYKVDGRRKDYWVFRRQARVKHLGDVTTLFSRRRRNDGPKRIKLIVTNLTQASTGQILSYFARRWGIELTIKELKSGLHWGQMQVMKTPERVRKALLLPIMAYQLLSRLYGRQMKPEEKFSFWHLKRRFVDDIYQEHLNRSEQRWRKNSTNTRSPLSSLAATCHFSVSNRAKVRGSF